MASLDLAILDKATETDIQLWSFMMKHWITVKVPNPSSLSAVESWLTESIAKREYSVLSRMTMLPVLLTCTEENLDTLCAQHNLSDYLLTKLPIRNRVNNSRIYTEVIKPDNLSEIKPSILRLWTSILSKEKPISVYKALYDFFDHLTRLHKAPLPVTPTKRLGSEGSTLASLSYHWNGEYIGPCREVLRDIIRGYESIGSADSFYSKVLLFVQSSGAGKSRLADAYGEVCPMAAYILREDDNGFPPRDYAVLKAMRSEPNRETEAKMLSPHAKREGIMQRQRVDNIWFHAIAVGILQATFEICKYF